MKVLQQMANKGEITIDHSTVKLNPVSESSLFDYSSSENDTDDDEEQDDDECCDKSVKNPSKRKIVPRMPKTTMTTKAKT